MSNIEDRYFPSDPILTPEETERVPEDIRIKIQAAWDALDVQGQEYAAEIRRLHAAVEVQRERAAQWYTHATEQGERDRAEIQRLDEALVAMANRAAEAERRDDV